MRSVSSRLIISAIVACFLAGCGGGGSSAPAASVSPPPVVAPVNGTFSMVMNTPWTDTGMTLASGERLDITASGTFNRETGSCGGTCVTTPGGVPWSTCATQPLPAYIAPGLACWSLIGKIGASGTPFLVGDSLLLTAPIGGELYLGINDNYFVDDTGNWTVTVKKV